MASDTFLASFGLIGLRLVALYGFTAERFAQQIGCTEAGVADAERRVSAGIADAGFAKASTLIADPAFALRAAECWHPSHLGTLGYAWLSSGSLRTALARLARFTRLVSSSARMQCRDTDAGLAFTYDSGRGNTPLGHTLTDFGLSLVMAMCRTNYGRAFQPDEVWLQRPRPRHTSPYDAFFGGRVVFGAAENGFLLPYAVADQPLPTANRELAQTFDDILVQQLSRLAGDDLEHRCRTFLLQELTSGEPSEERLANALAMSSRTLQRKLCERGQSYRMLLEQTRHELARKYLEDPARSVTEITFLLGFSDQSAFTRAFKRWEGSSPSAYRGVLVAA